MRLGQVQELLFALHEAEPGQAAASDRDLRLPHVITRIAVVGGLFEVRLHLSAPREPVQRRILGIEETEDPHQPVRLQRHRRHHARRSHQERDREPTEAARMTRPNHRDGSRQLGEG